MTLFGGSHQLQLLEERRIPGVAAGDESRW